MQIDQTEPLIVHKSIAIKVLRDHPEDLHGVCPGFQGSALEAVAQLEAAQWEWMVGDARMTAEEFAAWEYAKDAARD